MRLLISALPSFLGALLVAAAAAAPAAAESPKPDSGKFSLLVKGKSIGTDTFRLLPDGCDSDVHIVPAPGRDVQFHQTLKFKKGQLTQVTTDAGTLGAITITVAADKSTLKVGDKAALVQKLPATVYPFGNSSPHLFAFLISAYDAKKGGEQIFSMVFSEGAGPAGITVLSATVKDPETVVKQISGKPVSISRYPITIGGGAAPIAMEIQTDKDKHVLFWTVPAQGYSAVRDGFQQLAN